MAQYFGTKYVFLEELLNPLDKYKNDPQHWERIDEAGIWKFKPAPEMYSWTITKPAVLVIGSQKARAYEPFFRVSVNGGYNYDDGILVQGKENIDSYNLAELKKFNSVVLFGYSYNNRNAAYRMLDQYVKEGGNLYISTGWQFTDKDWQLKDSPEFFPVNGVTWSAEQKPDGTYTIDNAEIGARVNPSALPPLTWGNEAWGVSIPRGGIKEWAKPVLTYDGTPLIVAGTYGNGRVVWSGVNLPGHIHAFGYLNDEITLFNNILRWLGHGQPGEEETQTQKMTIARDYPDKVQFTFTEGATSESLLYWRETEYPSWNATLIQPNNQKQKVAIYRAGPGFMLMRLPALTSGSQLILEFHPGLRTFFGRILSCITLITLIAYVVFGTKIFNKLLLPFHRSSKKTLHVAGHKMKNMLGKASIEEEQY
jgi:hypothetical protein